MADTEAGQTESQGPAPAATLADDVLGQILDQGTKDQFFKTGRAQDDRQKANMEAMLSAFVNQVATGNIQKTDSLEQALDAAIAKLDGLLTAQLNLVIHHPQFQKVESTWRGLNYLVHQSETSETLKIRVMDVNKKDLAKDLMKAVDFDQSGLFKQIYEAEFGTPGGTPYGALISDFEFTNADPDMALLEKIAEVAAASHAPFFAGAGAPLFGLTSWTELSEPRDLSKKFEGPDYARWRAFRAKDESKYVGLCMPRVLGRIPYGEKTDPVESFRFQEEASGSTHENYNWMSAAWAMGARLTDAFAKYGFCTAIIGRENGGTVEGLPVHTFPTNEGTLEAKCPTEIAITDRRDGELDKQGVIPLCYYKNTNYAVFFAAQAVHKPQVYNEAWATANADLTSQVPYVMAVSRFAHYLKVMQRDKLGSFRERADVERELQNWIANYVLLNPETSGDRLKAEKPLAAAQVTVVDDPAKPGQYKAQVLLRPHFMLKKIDVSLRLVASLDKQK